MQPLKPLEEQTIVITGASSGIGRATARAAASRGARVVLTARDADALRELESEIRRDGGRALAVAGDVTVESDLMNVAERAAETFEGIDTWVNNAAVSLYGEFMDVPVEDMKRLMDVNFFGQVHGARAALPHLLRQGRGVLICVGSALSERAVPMQMAYCASKAAVKAMTESLRVELAHAGSEVQVTLIKPSSMNTPLFDQARTYMGVKPKPMSPVYDPELVAQAILHAAEHRTRELSVGGAAQLLAALETFGGPLIDWWMTRTGEQDQATQEPKQPDAPHNLHRPVAGHRSVRSSFGGRRRSLYTSARLHPRAALTTGAAVAAALGAWRALRIRD